MIGCGRRAVEVAAQEKTVYIQAETNWMELKDLRIAAESHLRARYPDFNPAGAEVSASIYRVNETNFVTFSYFWNFGLPVYYVKFDPKADESDRGRGRGRERARYDSGR